MPTLNFILSDFYGLWVQIIFDTFLEGGGGGAGGSTLTTRKTQIFGSSFLEIIQWRPIPRSGHACSLRRGGNGGTCALNFKIFTLGVLLVVLGAFLALFCSFKGLISPKQLNIPEKFLRTSIKSVAYL